MPYATPQDLIDRLGLREATAISDRARTGDPDLDELARLLAEADSEVNGYVGRRYAVPLVGLDGQPAATPLMLMRLVIDIARFHATGTEVMHNEVIAGRYKAAVRLLESIADGTVKLGDLVVASVGGPAPTGGSTATRTGEKTFVNLPEVL